MAKQWYRCSLDEGVVTEEPYTDVLAAGPATAAADYLADRGHDADDEPIVTVVPIDNDGQGVGPAEHLQMRARVVWGVARG